MSNVKCANCGLVNFADEEKCKRCGLSLTGAEATSSDTQPANYTQPASPIPDFQSANVPTQNPITKAQGFVLIGLLSAGLLLLLWIGFRPQPKYEYKVIDIVAQNNDRSGDGALKFNTINVDEGQLASMGVQGWELVGTFLEMETAYPNFGKSEYVTGLQPNVRPQRVVLIFKKPR
jgi:hypothetical protein